MSTKMFRSNGLPTAYYFHLGYVWSVTENGNRKEKY